MKTYIRKKAHPTHKPSGLVFCSALHHARVDHDQPKLFCSLSAFSRGLRDGVGGPVMILETGKPKLVRYRSRGIEGDWQAVGDFFRKPIKQVQENKRKR